MSGNGCEAKLQSSPGWGSSGLVQGLAYLEGSLWVGFDTHLAGVVGLENIG